MKVFTKTTLFTGALACLIIGCSEDQPATELPFRHEFARLPDGVDTRLKPVADSLLALEQRAPFMNWAIETYGTPNWNYAMLQQQNNGLVTLVPLVKKGEIRISGILAVSKKDRVRFRIFDAKKPAKYGYNGRKSTVNARHVFIVTDLFNQRMFDHDPAVMDDPCMMTGTERAYIENARKADASGKISIFVRSIFGYVETCYATAVCVGDGNGNCVGEVTIHKDCILSPIWVDDSGSLEGGYYPDGTAIPGLGGGGGSAPGQSSNDGCNGYSQETGAGEYLAVLPPAKPITDVRGYIGCFSVSKGAIITFYADQPTAGVAATYSMKEKVGHAYITIEQLLNGRIVRRTLGYHPSGVISPFLNKDANSVLGDDSNEPYDVRLSVSVTGETLGTILGLVQNYNPVYNLENYNCTNFVLDIADASGVRIARTKGTWGVGAGLNPGNFGEDLKKMPGAVATFGKSAENNGNCN